MVPSVLSQTSDVVGHGTLFAVRDGRRLSDDPSGDASDARLAGRPLTLGRVVADVSGDVLASEDRVDIGVHVHPLGQPDGVDFRHDAARRRAPFRAALVECIRRAPTARVVPPSHFLHTPCGRRRRRAKYVSIFSFKSLSNHARSRNAMTIAAQRYRLCVGNNFTTGSSHRSCRHCPNLTINVGNG